MPTIFNSSKKTKKPGAEKRLQEKVVKEEVVKKTKKEPKAKVKKEVKKTVSQPDALQTMPRKASVLAAFVTKPKNLHFETQEKKEKIVLLLRRHPITNLGWLLGAGSMFWLPFIAGRILPLEVIPANFLFMGMIIWGLLIFGFSFERFLNWFFNVNILTDERVIDIDFPSLLYRDISQAKIENIQDISVKSSGYLRSLLNFGDVEIQTAGTVPEICFEAVPNPEQVTKIINQLIYQEEKEKLEGRIR